MNNYNFEAVIIDDFHHSEKSPHLFLKYELNFSRFHLQLVPDPERVISVYYFHIKISFDFLLPLPPLQSV